MAAIHLINTNGFADTSMSKIAKQAGVSPATIYIYFNNKEDLLNTIYLHVKKHLSTAIFVELNEQLPVKNSLKLILGKLYQYCLEHQDKFAFMEQYANSPLIDKISREKASIFFKPLMDLITRGKKEGTLKDIPDEILAVFVFCPLAQLAKNHIKGDFEMNNKNIEHSFQCTWDAIVR